MSVDGLKRLKVWERAKDFAVKIYKQVLPLLPQEEKWSLNQQIRRSSTSISANIAEGHGRFYYQDNVRFCYNARGSLEETLSHLIVCFEAGLIAETVYKELESEGEEIEKMLNGYIAFLKKSKQGENEPGANHKVREEAEPYNIETSET
ncbi:MAG: four helix bundle protein [Anaerolineales bacterium]|jgi:four helix bundle protein|uniref:four helix bundle protein n=1 Tax=Candidatus Villigracilis affinis TaxID=3140682 RepID=UPI002A1F9DFE|nr:four helix bundle protein [Anaerolineales bacterium]MBL0345466.1 four helix bundle protein [Anaerolineales bacterium]